MEFPADYCVQSFVSFSFKLKIECQDIFPLKSISLVNDLRSLALFHKVPAYSEIFLGPPLESPYNKT